MPLIHQEVRERAKADYKADVCELLPELRVLPCQAVKLLKPVLAPKKHQARPRVEPEDERNCRAAARKHPYCQKRLYKSRKLCREYGEENFERACNRKHGKHQLGVRITLQSCQMPAGRQSNFVFH